MRDDQIQRLTDLANDITEVFIEEADPKNWSGAGMPLSEIKPEVRGNRYWDKKNAIQTGTLLARVLDLAARDSRSVTTKTEEDDAEKEIAAYEKKAKDLINGIQQRQTH